MGRPTTVDYKDVKRAILAVMGEGTSVTFPKVYAKLGNRGGGSTVTTFIEQFNKEVAASYDAESDVFAHGKIHEALTDVPDLRLVELIRDSVLAAQSVANELAAARFAEKAAALEEERQRLQADREAAQNAIGAAEAMVRQIDGELSVARAEIAGRDARIGDLQSTLTLETAQRRAAEARVSELSGQLADQSRRHEASMAELDLRHTGQMSSLQNELALERERAAGERMHMAAQTDALRQDKAREVANLGKQLTAAIDDARRVAMEKDGEIARLRAQVDAGRQDLTEALASMTRAHGEMSSLRVRYDQQAVDMEALRKAHVRIPTIVTGCTDDRDRWLSADAWCSDFTPVGHDDTTQGCPQATGSAPLTLAGGRLWGTRIGGTGVTISPSFASTRPSGRSCGPNAESGRESHRPA